MISLFQRFFVFPAIFPEYSREKERFLINAYNTGGSYVVDGVLIGCKSVISNEEQIIKKFARF